MTILLFINDKHGLHFVRLHLDRKRSAFVRHERVKQLLIEIRAKDAQERLVPLKYRRRRLWRRVVKAENAVKVRRHRQPVGDVSISKAAVLPERIRRFDFLMNYNRGDLMMLAAGVVWALYSIIGKKLPVPPITATTCSVFFSLLLWPFAFFYPFPADHISAAGLAGLVYICLFPSILSFLFWNISVQKVGPSHAGVYLNYPWC